MSWELRNREILSIPIIKGRGNSGFTLTKTVAGRINKQEPAHANLLKSCIPPMHASSRPPFPAHSKDSRSPSHPIGAFEFPIPGNS